MIFACFLEFIKPIEMKEMAFIRIFQTYFRHHYHPSPFFLVPTRFVNWSAIPLLLVKRVWQLAFACTRNTLRLYAKFPRLYAKFPRLYAKSN